MDPSENGVPHGFSILIDSHHVSRKSLAFFRHPNFPDNDHINRHLGQFLGNLNPKEAG